MPPIEDPNQQMQRVQALIRDKRYNQARELLVRMDDPRAEAMVQKLSIATADPDGVMEGVNYVSPIGPIPGDDNTVIRPLGSKDLNAAVYVGGALALLITSVIAIFIGLALNYSTQITDYQLVVFPVIAAAAGGVALNVVLGVLRVRGPLTVVLALITGLLIYGTYWNAQYNDFLRAAQVSSTAEARDAFDQRLRAEYGIGGVLGFVILTGDTRGQPVRGEQLIPFFDDYFPFLPQTETLIYWIVELGIMLLIPVIFTSGRRRKIDDVITTRG